ncbi:hypothetical protein JHK87_033886 [Glycine soja]|nr:hypothetical protein JHK87_033886 [Glycine soja]
MDPNVIEIPPPTTNNNNTCNSIKQKEAIFHHEVINTDKDNDSTKLILFGQKVGKGKAIQTTHQNMEVCEDVIGKSRWTYGHSSSSESSNDEEDDDNCFDFFSKDYMTSQSSLSLEPTIKDPPGVQYSQTPLSKKKSNGSQQRRRKLKLPWEMGWNTTLGTATCRWGTGLGIVVCWWGTRMGILGGIPYWGLLPAGAVSGTPLETPQWGLSPAGGGTPKWRLSHVGGTPHWGLQPARSRAPKWGLSHIGGTSHWGLPPAGGIGGTPLETPQWGLPPVGGGTSEWGLSHVGGTPHWGLQPVRSGAPEWGLPHIGGTSHWGLPPAGGGTQKWELSHVGGTQHWGLLHASGVGGTPPAGGAPEWGLSHISGTPHWGLSPTSGVGGTPLAGGAPNWGQAGVSMMTVYNPYHSNFVGPSYHHPGSESINQMWSTNAYNLQAFPNYNYYYPYDYNYTAPFAHHFHVPPGPLIHNSWVYNSVGDGNNEATANNTVATISDEARGEILRKFQSFKQFDVIEDVSDHHFVHANSSMEQHSKHWAKRIQGEWKSLEKDLPDSIFVRVYESRIDLLRAVIIGAKGTPYHDGLFFFDVFFSSGYPHVPPNFKDFVAGNFCSRAHDILVACKAYIDGAQVGCVVKGGAQDVDQGDSSSSVQFRTSLAAFVNMLVNEFTQVGAKDCDKVFPLTAVGNSSSEMLTTVGNPSGVKLTAVGNMSGEMVAAVGNASGEMLVAAASIP